MGDTTAIAWTEKTWNPWQGCHKVSAGCANCYMYRDKARFGQDPATVVRSKPATFNAPLKWKEPALVFTCSWSDFFIEEADPWRDEAWELIRRTPHITYQVLTKRPERIAGHLPGDWGAGWSNVWLGLTAENEAALDRLAYLRDVPAALRFVSAEPLLGSLDLRRNIPSERILRWHRPALEGVGWVIVGGESGPNARAMYIQWAAEIVAQCRAAGVPVFVKQLGAHPYPRRIPYPAAGPHAYTLETVRISDRSGAEPSEWPEDLRIREMPK